MRPFHAALVALSLVAVAGTASADDQPKPKKPKKTATAPATKKVASAKKAPAKKPAPVKVAEPEPQPEEETASADPEPTLNAPADADAAKAPSTSKSSKPSKSSSSLAKPSSDTPVDAEPPAPMASTVHPFSVAPLLGVSSGYLRYGVGARAGYTLPSHVYLGAGFMYRFGSTLVADTLGIDGGSAHAVYPSFEGGYDLKVGPVIIRPYVGAALIFTTVSSPAILNLKASSSTSLSLGIYPGGAVAYDIPNTPIFVGADARLLFDFDTGTSFALSMSAGVRF